MARVSLIVNDPANRITLKTLLEGAGHSIVDAHADVAITDEVEIAINLARNIKTLLLTTASGISEAVAAMVQGVYGYVTLPLQPGEAEIMVERAASGTVRREQPLRTLEEVEAELIVDTLRRCRNNQAEAARVLGIGRNTLWRKLKKIQAQ